MQDNVLQSLKAERKQKVIVEDYTKKQRNLAIKISVKKIKPYLTKKGRNFVTTTFTKVDNKVIYMISWRWLKKYFLKNIVFGVNRWSTYAMMKVNGISDLFENVIKLLTIIQVYIQ